MGSKIINWIYENILKIFGICIIIFLITIPFSLHYSKQPEAEKYCIEWDRFISRDGLNLSEVVTDNILFHGWKVFFTIDWNGDLLRWKYNDFIDDSLYVDKTFECTKWVEVISQKGE